MSKIRTLSAGVLCAAGLSLAGAFVGPAVANAAPGQPGMNQGDQMHAAGGPMHPGQGMRPEPPPTHPVYHYSQDLTHPVWSVTHPVSALLP
jgi:hypothetical protein